MASSVSDSEQPEAPRTPSPVFAVPVPKKKKRVRQDTPIVEKKPRAKKAKSSIDLAETAEDDDDEPDDPWYDDTDGFCVNLSPTQLLKEKLDAKLKDTQLSREQKLQEQQRALVAGKRVRRVPVRYTPEKMALKGDFKATDEEIANPFGDLIPGVDDSETDVDEFDEQDEKDDRDEGDEDEDDDDDEWVAEEDEDEGDDGEEEDEGDLLPSEVDSDVAEAEELRILSEQAQKVLAKRKSNKKSAKSQQEQDDLAALQRQIRQLQNEVRLRTPDKNASGSDTLSTPDSRNNKSAASASSEEDDDDDDENTPRTPKHSRTPHLSPLTDRSQ